MSFLDTLKHRFRTGDMVTRLLFINIGAFLIFASALVVLRLFNFYAAEDYTRYFAVPSNLNVLPIRFWTPITYMFYHERFFHILFNMLVLYWFGKIFIVYFAEKQLLSLYVFGGLMGAAAFVLAYNIFPYYYTQSFNSILMGASGSVVAILVASAVRAPDMEMRLLLLGNVKLKWIAVATVLVSFFGLTSENAGGEMAHLGGALAGYLFVVFEKKGTDITAFVTVVLDFFANRFRPKPQRKAKVYHAQKMSPEQYNQKKAADTKEIDRILDKIKNSGYESLTAEEKRKLFEQR